MFKDYYQKELRYLKELGREFAREHPILAPFLEGPRADPDVERLLEGVAFLTASINQKLEDELPEVLHNLMQMVCPHYLRPVPAATVIAFAPKENLSEPLNIPAGTCIDSEPVNDVACRFQTCWDVKAMPLRITAAERVEQNLEGLDIQETEIRLQFQFTGMTLGDWDDDALYLHLAGDYAEAADLYFLLLHHLKKVEIAAPGASIPVSLPPEALEPAGFAPERPLLPYPTNVFPSFRIIQEYFLFPEKFMFLKLNLDQWRARGSGASFSISFFCDAPAFDIPAVTADRFRLFCTPAVNLFQHDAAAAALDQRENEVPVLAEGMARGTYQIYSVDQVSGFPRGSDKKRAFVDFTDYTAEKTNAPVFNATFRPSLAGDDADVYLAVAYPPDEILTDTEILTMRVTCTNGALPDLLQSGDICIPTSNTPELVSYRNITPPSAGQPPPLEKDFLWRMLSHLSLNYLSIANAESMKSLLSFYIFPGGKDKPRIIANKKRISGILSMEVAPRERVFGKSILRGQSVHIKTRNDHFSGMGDMYLFGQVIDYFLGAYASMNTFTALSLEDILRGERIEWPPRLGDRPLL